jgi:hypothetical protein
MRGNEEEDAWGIAVAGTWSTRRMAAADTDMNAAPLPALAYAAAAFADVLQAGAGSATLSMAYAAAQFRGGCGQSVCAFLWASRWQDVHGAVGGDPTPHNKCADSLGSVPCVCSLQRSFPSII